MISILGENGLIPIDYESNTAKWDIMDFNQKIISSDRFENSSVILVSHGIGYDVNENGRIIKK